MDSSVLVSAFVKRDESRPEALTIIEKMFSGQYRVTTSATVFVEVCGAIARRAGADKAVSVKNQLLRWESMNFIGYSELNGKRRREAAELATALGLKGMDAIVVQVAKERKAALITFDEEMAEKAKSAVNVLSSDDSRTGTM